jgi:hypothetical protein
MKSIKHLAAYPVSLPLAADDILEFHAARLLLLLEVCGTAGRIDGLTKMAKLDFFNRYPDFFAAATAAKSGGAPDAPIIAHAGDAVESAMVRHHYGPWDLRYYHTLAYLEANQLISVKKHKNAYQISLTNLGRDRAKALISRPSFRSIVDRMRQVKQQFGQMTGNSLKQLIYSMFEKEVVERPLGELIG